MKAILPAAGFATRFYPFTKHSPKALLYIHGQSLIDLAIEKIIGLSGITEIIVITNRIYFPAFVQWRKKVHSPVSITLVDDGIKNNEERLGAIGDLQFALDTLRIDDDLLILLPDNIFSFELLDMHRSFIGKDALIALYDVQSKEIAKRMGTTLIDDEHKINQFKEKDQYPETTLCATGVYFLSRKTKDLIKQYADQGHSLDNIGEFFSWLCTQKNVYGHVIDIHKEYWFDVGNLEEFTKASEILAIERRRSV